MSAVESYITSNPFGKAEECAMFTVDDSAFRYVMPGLTDVGQEYTLSFWVKSDSASILIVCNTKVTTSTSWQRQTITFTATGENISFAFGDKGAHYIYRAKLEKGNKATDWTPAPEDVEATFNERIDEQSTSIINNSREIILSALESYVETSDYDGFKETVEAQLRIMSDTISMNFTTTTTDINTVDEKLDTKFTELEKRIDFSGDGITISAGEGSPTLRLDNDVIFFEQGGTTFGWWDKDNFKTGNILVDVNERAQFGNFAFIPRSDGSLSFLKVAHNTGMYVRLVNSTMFVYGAYPTLEDTTLVISDMPGELDGTTLILKGEE